MGSAIERFEASYIPEPNTGCWLWARAQNDAKGYGRFTVGERRVLAHRFSYETHVGPVPTGTELDHLCRTRSCVNPAHLEPVAHRENVLRGESPIAMQAAQTHCLRGHVFDHENTRYYRNRRVCRACKNEYERAERARRSRGRS